MLNNGKIYLLLKSEILYFDSLSSTNDKAMEMLLLGCNEGLVVAAHKQVAGRGQQGAHWESEDGKNLTFSIALKPKFLRAEQMFYLSKAVSLGVCDFLREQGVAAAIKWPNDIYVGDEKICGILIEQSISGEHISSSVVGIGININQRAFNHAPNATSLLLLDGKERNLEHSIKSVIDYILNRYKCITNVCNEIDAEYYSLLYRRNAFFPYRSGNTNFMAKIVGVEPSGELILQKESGDVERYWFKEVEFVL